ncbi:MAG: hypothetical protein JW864_05375 [Spirochaetes bacterium]|nr:hypothetical protein [Spirochaetota bacterium]
MEPLAPHEKLFVDTDFIENDENHGEIPCSECHGGDPNDPNWETAHKGLSKDPSYTDPEKTCGECHDHAGENYKNSLHYNLKPYHVLLDKRANPDKKVREKLNSAMDTHCLSCHSSCGQCHISRPNSVEGGLLSGHFFQKKPLMKQTCTACHGSRIGEEYSGSHEGLEPDIHSQKYFMKCEKCHTAEEMHGDGKIYNSRYDVENGPMCLKCHEKIYTDKSKARANHSLHKDKISCYVCHSQSYINCYSCHVGKDKNGISYFKTKPPALNFKIGLNPKKSLKRPENYVTLRHIPIDKKLFDFYVKDGLTQMNAVPTWKLTTPHNIQRITKQNSGCNNCHGNSSIFLLDKDVSSEEKDSNRNVIVPESMIPVKQ